MMFAQVVLLVDPSPTVLILSLRIMPRYTHGSLLIRWRCLLINLSKFVTRVAQAALRYAAISMRPELRDSVVNVYLPFLLLEFPDPT
jgi:hypothetical protein